MRLKLSTVPSPKSAYGVPAKTCSIDFANSRKVALELSAVTSCVIAPRS